MDRPCSFSHFDMPFPPISFSKSTNNTQHKTFEAVWIENWKMETRENSEVLMKHNMPHVLIHRASYLE